MGTSNPAGGADSLLLGDWNAICFRCGSKFKASTMTKNWQGFYTCRRCYEPRQPQDFATGIKEITTPPWTQPPPADKFTTFCSPNDRTAVPGYMIPGCVRPGFVDPAWIGRFTPIGEIYPYVPSALVER
jgi:hypothetical protein